MTEAQYAPRARRFRTSWRAFLTGFCLIAGNVHSAGIHAQQSDDISSLAFSIAESVIDATKTSETKPVIRVQDFRQTNGPANQLGIALANQVSDRLAQLSKTSVRYFFFVADRPPNAPTGLVDQPCDSQHPWPSLLVTGDMDEVSGRLALRVQVIRVASSQPIFDRRVSLPMDSSMEAEFGKAFRVEPQPSDIWVKPGYALSEEEESKASQVDQKAEGFRSPACLRCAAAQYTNGALAAKIEGRIRLKMLLGQGGDPLKLVIIDGLPCGLNQAALRSVATWKLVSAKGPDGKAVEIWQEIEVNFQRY